MAIRYFKPQGSPIKRKTPSNPRSGTDAQKGPAETTKQILDDLKKASHVSSPDNTDPLIEAMKDNVVKAQKLQQEINQIVEGSRGPKRTATKVSIRLNDEIIEHFKAQGSGWQTRINEVLADYVKSQSK